MASGDELASGGVDFFLAGVNRAVEEGGMVGAHSWSQLGSPDGGDPLQAHLAVPVSHIHLESLALAR